VNTAAASWCQAWIEHDWVAINAEDCPTGRQYKKVVGLFSMDAVFQQYVKAFGFTAEAAAGQVALSKRSFSRILNHHLEVSEIAVRSKKNVSGKCDGKRYDSIFSCN
jgi:hypothetical protein